MFRKTISLAFLIGIGAISNANLIVNGDFEADSYPVNNYSVLSSLTGWTILGTGNVAGIGVGYLGATSQEIDLSGISDGYGSGIEQTVTTDTSTVYTLSFDVRIPIKQSVEVRLNNSLIYSGLVAGTYTYNFTGTGSDTVTFISESGNTTHLDNVSIEAVPEPGTMAALAMGGLALARRRRAK